MSSRPRYRFTFEAMPPEPGEAPVGVRLRRLLKIAGRAFRLRCTEAIELRGEEADPLRGTGEGPPWEEAGDG